MDILEAPHSLQELIQLKDHLSVYKEGSRLPEDEEFYLLYRELVPDQIVDQIIKRQMRGNSIALVKNNFPYTGALQYLPSVVHYCLWSLEGSVSPERIAQEVGKKFEGKEWFFFENAPEVKSIHDIWHAHVMINLS